MKHQYTRAERLELERTCTQLERVLNRLQAFNYRFQEEPIPAGLASADAAMISALDSLLEEAFPREVPA